MVAKQICQSVIFGLLLFVSSALTAASITIDRSTVRVNETFELTVNLNNQPDVAPDLSALPDDLEVISNNSFFRRSIINGRSTQESGWRFTIRATNEGIFTIPAIDVEGSKTQPFSIKVLPAVNSADVDGKTDAIRLTSDIDQSDVYVQEQIIYTIRLFRSVQAQYATLSEPQLAGALIEKLGDDVQYDTVLNATPYRVLERKYAIYPQESGTFEISGVVYTAEVVSGNRRFSTLGSLRGRNRSISLTTDAKPISVKTIPTGYNNWWLPAKNIEVSQKWSTDTQTLEVGSPVTWTYTIQAQGLTATQIPDIQPTEVDGLKFYPEQAVSTNAFADNDIVASRTQKIAVIPTTAGEIIIPAVEIPWWNIEEDKAVTLLIPEKTLNVLPGPEFATQPAQQSTAMPPVTTPANNLTPTDVQSEPEIIMVQPLYWQIATGVLAVLWLVTLFWRSKQKTKLAPEQAPEAPTEKVVQPSNLSDIKSSLTKGDAGQARKAIISYLQNLGFAISSLAELIKQQPDTALAQQLKALDKSVFGTGSNEDWQTETIIQGLSDIKPPVTGGKMPESATAIPPLHPE